ncbi:hypothetical protein AB4Y44_35890 [Paraburkholderia sp. BR10937]|uniref:hypothetical protein n=1 Tax=Paraburkholderia sp. BR10937 TaxID=3236994 RepID=UPI0034D192A9
MSGSTFPLSGRPTLQRFRFEDFVNRDGRRVLDEAGRQGIDGVTNLGSSTEVRCGLILQALVGHAPYLADFQLDDTLGWVRQLRDGVPNGQPGSCSASR